MIYKRGISSKYLSKNDISIFLNRKHIRQINLYLIFGNNYGKWGNKENEEENKKKIVNFLLH